MAGQQIQNAEFDGRQLQRIAIHRRGMRLFINRKRGDPDDMLLRRLRRNLRLRGVGRAAKQRFHASDQLQRIKRLHHIIIRSGHQPGNLIHIAVPRA
ncbi:hypothetical protein D3C81_2035060 [compost metagenome]